MPASAYIRGVRSKIGNDLLMLQSVISMPFDSEGRLLMAQDAATGMWMCVGGAIEPDEMPADAAVRECWEETGLLIEPTGLIGVFGGPDFRVTYANGDCVCYVVTVFTARLIGGQPRPDGQETSAVRFFSQAETAGLPTAAGTRRML